MLRLMGILASAFVLAALGCGSNTQGGLSSSSGNAGGGGAGAGTSGTGGAGAGTSEGGAAGTNEGGAGGTTAAPAFTEVYEKVFAPRGCTDGACHYGGGFSLSPQANAYTALVGAPASGPGCGGAVRVVPGDPEHSLLYLKVSMTTPPCGARMPLNAAPLDASQVALVRAWIESGATE